MGTPTPGRSTYKSCTEVSPGLQNGGWEVGWVGSKDFIHSGVRLSPEYVLGAPTWSWTLGAVSAPCPATGHPKTPDPTPQPHKPSKPPAFSQWEALLGSKNEALLAFSVQVEILNSNHRTLHKLHGEQVEARHGGGGRSWGIRTLEYYRDGRGNV